MILTDAWWLRAKLHHLTEMQAVEEALAVDDNQQLTQPANRSPINRLSQFKQHITTLPKNFM